MTHHQTMEERGKLGMNEGSRRIPWAGSEPQPVERVAQIQLQFLGLFSRYLDPTATNHGKTRTL